MDDVLDRGTRSLNAHTAETDSTVLLLLDEGRIFPIMWVSADEHVADSQRRCFELVDEVLTVPLSRAELRLRLNVLDRARGEDGDPEAYQLILRDVTRAKEREARLATLATAVDRAPDHIFVADAEGTIEFLNEAFEKDLGYSPEEMNVGEVLQEVTDTLRPQAQKSGFQIKLDQLRETDGVSEALMIAVPAYALPGDGENVHAAGFDGYVSKPFTRETLREHLIQVL